MDTTSLSSTLTLDHTDDFLSHQIFPEPPPAVDRAVAPWLDPPSPTESGPGAGPEPPTPPPKYRTTGFHKPSLSSIASTVSLRSASRASDVTSIGSGTTTLTDAPRYGSDTSIRKFKSGSSIVDAVLKKVRSRSRLRPEQLNFLSPTQDPVPPLPSPDAILYSHPPAQYLPPSTPRVKPHKRKTPDEPPPLPSKNPDYVFDLNIENMDGIVDLKTVPEIPSDAHNGEISSPSSGTHSSSLSSDVSSTYRNRPSIRARLPSSSHGVFRDPFAPVPPNSKRKAGPPAYDGRKISPKTRPLSGDSQLWKAPESWAVEPGNEDFGNAQEPTSTDDEDMLLTEGDPLVECPDVAKKKNLRKRRRSSLGKTINKPTYKFRIYRADSTYHVASIELSATVKQLMKYLNNKLLLDPDRETHRLYLKERGRERILSMTEKPANIVRKRLQEAGYEEADGLPSLGMDDIQFLMKFVYKSNVLGRTPQQEDILDNLEFVDLTARALTTVPVALYPHADAIVLLNLSRNPMLEIPLDFIQSCTSLRELRLSGMAMKKVPQSVRHCTTLHRLDLSCNRITDLDDAGLEDIPGLRTLKLQNNGMERLPWHFPRLRSLRELNISNNKFRQLPEVVCKIPSLIDLDISFNMISDLPEEIGNLEALEKLVMVGNHVARLPVRFGSLTSLRSLDCRRNNILNLATACLLPQVENVLADHNLVHALELSFGPSLLSLDVSNNDITQLTLLPGPDGRQFSLKCLDLSHAKLSSLDDLALSCLITLHTLRVDHNSIRALPDSIGELVQLRHLSCSNNQLYALPSTIGKLQKLEKLDAHNNSINELPKTIWQCASLCIINVTSNLLGTLHEPASLEISVSPPSNMSASPYMERKPSAAGSITNRTLPPLAYSLEKLYLGENRLTEDSLHPLMLLKELKALNLSFNDLQVIPPSFFKNLTCLEELYLSGNKLTALPTEDLPRLTSLKALYLNGNRLQSLPQELHKMQSLSILDVGSNNLKYNTNNWEFDWNWNFNSNLRYLNLSGNKRLEIKYDQKAAPLKDENGFEINLADFSHLHQLKVLGLMDVTTMFLPNIPDDNEDRRVRTSLSEVNKMAYGIADTLGGNLSMFDLVQPAFRERKNEAVFAMFGRASHIGSSNRVSKYLHDHFLCTFSEELEKVDEYLPENIHHALRRAFLKLNKFLHDFLYAPQRRKSSVVSASGHSTDAVDMSSVRSGASGVVLYFVDRTLYVANAGNALAVISRQGNAELLSRKHDPFDREETNRIRSAEGWISPKGYVNDEIDVSRSFGFYYLFPIVNARPDIVAWDLSELDEFVIIGNRGLWEFVSYQTAVDIARTVRGDPMIAAQKLRDFAISYGAEGTTMIMVISVAELFGGGPSSSRQPTTDLVDPEVFPVRRPDPTGDRGIARLDEEVPAPQGHLALVFTDIRNSTHLWECNAGMSHAINSHNLCLRRRLRLCGGYEVKTEGDAFICSFPNTMAALWWCLAVQIDLLNVAWPLEILECEDGKEIVDSAGRLIARGLSVRMGIHCGSPISDPDPTTHRMDYLGPVVNRAARISSSAGGGQIMCSADVIREVNASILVTEPPTEHTHEQPAKAVDAIRHIGVRIIPVGEVKLKGLEVPESLSLVYPAELAGRHDLETLQTNSDASGSRVQFSVEQMRELAMLCLRLETLTSSRVFRPLPRRKGSTANPVEDEALDANPVFLYGNPDVLLPTIDKASDTELMLLLDQLSMRIENALTALAVKQIVSLNKGDRSTRRTGAGFDVRTLQQLLSFLSSD
ncbi:hypothetical protein PHLCEN_2v11518 [Hermanssonia centrifuga]|uniref:Adenylate cyclase n=1 Tax=Hermanssonia centrifuga TaxID=98765 RepID=A0A2R6NJU1_9APHY|nr:hypothetical protein PHLCEN_2v11518 [Hermanssonia centrifuga]